MDLMGLRLLYVPYTVLISGYSQRVILCLYSRQAWWLVLKTIHVSVFGECLQRFKSGHKAGLIPCGAPKAHGAQLSLPYLSPPPVPVA